MPYVKFWLCFLPAMRIQALEFPTYKMVIMAKDCSENEVTQYMRGEEHRAPKENRPLLAIITGGGRNTLPASALNRITCPLEEPAAARVTSGYLCMGKRENEGFNCAFSFNNLQSSYGKMLKLVKYG